MQGRFSCLPKWIAMEPFKEVLDEVNGFLNKLAVFDILLNALLIFLSGYLTLNFLVIESVDQFYAIFPAAGYVVAAAALGMKRSKVLEVEKKYPQLNERLRTAADNLDMDNEIVQNLHREIKKKLVAVEGSSFFNVKKTSIKVSTAVVLCFLIIFMNSFAIAGISVKTIFPPPRISHIDTDGNGEGEPDQFGGGPGGGSNIETDQIGISGVAQLGDEELTLSLEAEGYELNIRDVKEVKKRYYDEVFPSETDVSSAAAYEENIPKEQQEIVNNYFKQITKG